MAHLCQRQHHLHCTIENTIDKKIILIDGSEYMNSGEVVIKPAGEVRAHSHMTFGVGEATIGGVSGGIAFRIGDGPDFAIGFTDPLIGYRKVGVALSSSGEAGYDSATAEGNSVEKDCYKITASIISDKQVATYKVESLK